MLEGRHEQVVGCSGRDRVSGDAVHDDEYNTGLRRDHTGERCRGAWERKRKRWREHLRYALGGMSGQGSNGVAVFSV